MKFVIFGAIAASIGGVAVVVQAIGVIWNKRRWANYSFFLLLLFKKYFQNSFV